MATASSATNLKTTHSSAELFTCHPPETTKSLFFSIKPNAQIEISSNKNQIYPIAESWKWRSRVSFFQGLLIKDKDVKSLKEELFEAIAPLDRGAEATPEDQERVDEIARKLEAVNKVKEPLKSNLLNGKWKLIYTTSQSVLETKV